MSSSDAGRSRRILHYAACVRETATEYLLRLAVPPADGEVMLSEQDRDEFAERGVVWLRGAFGADDAATMRRRVWSKLAKLRATEHDPATLVSDAITRL